MGMSQKVELSGDWLKRAVSFLVFPNLRRRRSGLERFTIAPAGARSHQTRQIAPDLLTSQAMAPGGRFR